MGYHKKGGEDMSEQYSLIGINGNAFALMGYTRRAMKETGFTAEEISMVMEEAQSGDYSNLVVTLDQAIDACNERASG